MFEEAGHYRRCPLMALAMEMACTALLTVCGPTISPEQCGLKAAGTSCPPSLYTLGPVGAEGKIK